MFANLVEMGEEMWAQVAGHVGAMGAKALRCIGLAYRDIEDLEELRALAEHAVAERGKGATPHNHSGQCRPITIRIATVRMHIQSVYT